MKDEGLEENVYWMLVQVAMRAKHGLMRLAEAHDLTIMQMYTIGSMKAGEPIPMSTISCFLACDASNVTGIADRLLARGYIERHENPKDRRVKMISLTESGVMLRKKILETMNDYKIPEFARLDDAQTAQLKTILAILLPLPETRK